MVLTEIPLWVTHGSNADTSSKSAMGIACGCPLLLPLPSKDSETMDPEIRAAEKRLWAKIDQALHEYSGEVMMIQRKKRRLAEANP